MMRQAPQAPPTPELPRIDWTTLFNWDDLLPNLIRSAIIVAFAVVAYRVVKGLTRRLEREIAEEDPLVKRLREQRARTLASLVNNVALIAITTLAALMVLGTFIDIGPLLATAGIAGLAISFGAQSLVKDVINGAFILVEGQYGIGDVIRVGETAGMVERITLRTTTLRDIEGIVHIVPNGEVNRVSNLTKAWSRAVLDIGIAYKEDVDRVIGVLDEVGRALLDDPDWGPLLIDPPEVLGIQSFADSAVVIRMVAKTFPLKQWDVARELRRRIKRRFDDEGIEIPFPHVTLYWGAGQAPPVLAATREPDDSGPGSTT